MMKYFRKNTERKIYPVFNKGFHGDDFLIELSKYILDNCVNFIETGSAEGTTLSFVAKNHPKVKCYSCEPDQKVFAHAKSEIEEYPNVDLRNAHSPDFIIDLVKEKPEILEEKTFFWLDAHGYGFDWPLREELDFILANFSKSFIFIDDFKVPGQPQFGYDVYEGQECSLEYLIDILSKYNNRIYFPKYSKITSEYHPLRGWVLIEGTVSLMNDYRSTDVVEYKG